MIRFMKSSKSGTVNAVEHASTRAGIPRFSCEQVAA